MYAWTLWRRKAFGSPALLYDWGTPPQLLAKLLSDLKSEILSPVGRTELGINETTINFIVLHVCRVSQASPAPSVFISRTSVKGMSPVFFLAAHHEHHEVCSGLVYVTAWTRLRQSLYHSQRRLSGSNSVLWIGWCVEFGKPTTMQALNIRPYCICLPPYTGFQAFKRLKS